MDGRVKKLWVKALRSGEYKQGKGMMFHAGRFCCLGVLQKVAEDAGVEFHWRRSDTSILPGEVKSWSMLRGADADELAELNDSGADFHQIAACIENGL